VVFQQKLTQEKNTRSRKIESKGIGGGAEKKKKSLAEERGNSNTIGSKSGRELGKTNEIERGGSEKGN